MGLVVHLILEVRKPSATRWLGFYPRSLRIDAGLWRDYDFLKAMGLYPDQIESHPLEIKRGLPEDASDITLQSSCHLVFRDGGISADVSSIDGMEDEDVQRVITRGGIEFSYSTVGFCRNHTWMSYAEILRSLNHHDIKLDALTISYQKLLQRVEWFDGRGFETRLVGWVCN